MINGHLRLAPLFLLLAIFALGALAADLDEEFVHEMRLRSQIMQVDMHRESPGYRLLETVDHSSIPNFEQKALDLARASGVKVVSREKPIIKTTGVLGFKVKKKGPEEVFFFSLVHPESTLGKEMQLAVPQNPKRLASVLWRKGSGEPKVALVDVIADHGVQWSLDPLERVLGHV
ncbi:uncharacterized protein UTRI_10375_B [Ustilago trichophora]|uniref:Uncharacterized protein n=1 Tax=Ustilago trichophora TaxID=86804 RepID=A0A5C3E8N8_9BASI|nr:uncharacterized protein UTRI_10375_B [Ustilago trichophora]